jgi:cytosine/adenosine deaminase-related metal-dependent hydrolase
MGKDKRPSETAHGPQSDSDKHDHHDNDTQQTTGVSRRELLGSAAVGAALGALATAGLSPETLLAAPPEGVPPGPPPGAGQNILLKGGVVLTMDPNGGDLAKGDVLIEGTKIAAVGANLGGGGAAVIDCTGMIIMPGFVQTHHHQYETVQRAVIPDGLLFGTWPQEAYTTVVQSIWTAGRLTSGPNVLWDLGRSPYDPEDCYISELVAAWASINEGVTAGIDTSQSSHTPAYTDAMIQGLMDSGQRAMYVYANGTNRSAQFPDTQPNEYPGAIGNETSGLGRLRNQFFSSEDQLVTLGFSGGAGMWELARHYGAQIVNHDFNGGALIANQNNDPTVNGVGPDMVSIHAVNFTETAWQVAKAKGVKISIAGPIEMQMGHGTPPYQQALDAGILPSLSPDVDTNMAHDQFTLVRGAFTLQHLFARNVAVSNVSGPNYVNPYPWGANKELLSCRQALEMATSAGAAAFGPQAGYSSKFGMLKVGMEADVIVLNARAINTHPMINAPGTVVTMMDTSNVDTVIIGGTIKKRAGKLVGVNVEKLLKDIEAAQERVLSRIQGPALVGSIPDGAHSAPGYTPSMVGSCCVNDRPYPNVVP